MSAPTLAIAYEALLHMEQGVKPWAEMEGEESAQRVMGQIKAARKELKEVLGGR